MTDTRTTKNPQPRTEAGRAHLDYIRRWSEDEGATWTDYDTEEMSGRILAIEAEASSTSASLDVDRLGAALRAALERYPLESHSPEFIARGQAAEYARLTTTDEGEEEERPSIEDEWYEQDSGGGDGSAKGADATPAQAVTSLPRPSSGCRHQWTHIGGYPGEPEGLAYDMCSKCGKVKGHR